MTTNWQVNIMFWQGTTSIDWLLRAANWTPVAERKMLVTNFHYSQTKLFIKPTIKPPRRSWIVKRRWKRRWKRRFALAPLCWSPLMRRVFKKRPNYIQTVELNWNWNQNHVQISEKSRQSSRNCFQNRWKI